MDLGIDRFDPPKLNPVIIHEYDPLWPSRFESLRSRIADSLGGMAVAIEHVGSTAVPGMAAKPIIDMDVLLASTADLPLAIAKLAVSGYTHKGDLGVPSREAFRTPPDDYAHHLYVCLPDSLEYGRHIAFRDYLRTHPQDARAYAELKCRLAKTFREDREAYTHAKSDFVAEILQRVGTPKRQSTS